MRRLLIKYWLLLVLCLLAQLEAEIKQFSLDSLDYAKNPYSTDEKLNQPLQEYLV